MLRFVLWSVFLFVLSLALDEAAAQPPLPPFGNNSGSTSSDDQIEGSIWQYKGKLKKQKTEGGES